MALPVFLLPQTLLSFRARLGVGVILRACLTPVSGTTAVVVSDKPATSTAVSISVLMGSLATIYVPQDVSCVTIGSYGIDTSKGFLTNVVVVASTHGALGILSPAKSPSAVVVTPVLDVRTADNASAFSIQVVPFLMGAFPC